MVAGESPTLVVLTLFLLFGFYLFFRSFFKLLPQVVWITATPTSRIRSLALGLAEINGFVELRDPVISPATGQKCCLTKYKCQELRVTYTRRGRTTSWHTIDSGFLFVPFYLKDEKGNKVLVDPADAELDLPCETYYTKFDSGFVKIEEGTTRYLERAIYPRMFLYIMGEVKKRTSLSDLQEEVGDQLAVLRGSPEKTAAYDENKDGKLDFQEWDKAVAETEEKVKEKLFTEASSHPLETLIVAKPSTHRPFILATRSEKELLGNLRWRGYSALFFGILFIFFNLAGLLDGFFPRQNFAHGYFEMVKFIIQVITKSDMVDVAF
ncbi:MAG: hypothetical protein V2A65_07565 [Candidatus Omnitrophota bacterium]